MKKFLNTLYITTQGIYLHLEGESLVAEKEQKNILRLPLHTLSGIICFGNVMCSPFLLGHCAECGIRISFLTEYGKFLARVEGPVSGNVMLRTAQMKVSMDPYLASSVAKNIVAGKILNTRTVLQRYQRDHGENEKCSEIIQLMAHMVRRLDSVADLDTLRGIEGEAAKLYFSVFNLLLLNKNSNFQIKNRNRRPPLDPVNSMLSFLYTLLVHDCEAALEGVGLDPQIGFLHSLRPGRPSLALDLIEEFRAILADRTVLSLINLNQISEKDFLFSETGAVTLKDDARKTVLLAWQKKKKELINHPFLNEKIEIGLLPHAQALLLSRFLRGDLDAYPPFLWK